MSDQASSYPLGGDLLHLASSPWSGEGPKMSDPTLVNCPKAGVVSTQARNHMHLK